MVSIKDMSLSKKLIGGFGLVCMLLVIVAVVSITTLGTVQSENNKVIENTIMMKEKGLAMDRDMLQARVSEIDFYSSRNLPDVDAVNTNVANVTRSA